MDPHANNPDERNPGAIPPDRAPPGVGGDAPAAIDPKKPLTARRLRRKLWRVFLFAVAGLLLAFFVLTRTGVTKMLVLPQLEAATGAKIEAGSVVITPDLSLLMRDVRVRVPGLDGEAGEVFTAERLGVKINWAALPTPAAVSEIELEAPLIRVSQEAETGDINAAVLDLFKNKSQSGPIALPTVVVRNGVVELGEHTADGAYTQLAEFPVSGVLAPQPGGDSGRSLFSLTRRAGESGLEVTGYIDPKGVTFTLGGVNLTDWPASAIPTRFRDLWGRLALEGRIVPRTIAVRSTGEVEINVDLERVAITLPFAAENARSNEPARLTDVTGRIFVSDDRVSADLTGKAGPLQQRVVFDLFGFDPAESPFVARLVTGKLRWERDIALLEYVPPAVIEQTDRFGHPEAEVEAVIWLARGLDSVPSDRGLLARFQKPDGLAQAGDPLAVRLSGSLALRNGSAAFRGFNYRFDDLSVDFRFNTRELLVENIDGLSPTGAKLSGRGRISPLGPTSAVDLEFTVTELLADDALNGALNESRRQLLDVLFNQREYDELVDAGLIRTPADAQPMVDRLATIETERAAWAAAGGIAGSELARLAQEESTIHAELERVPVFGLAGPARVDMRFIRQEGAVSVWSRDIAISLPRVGFLTEMFPLPAIGHDAVVTILEDETRLVVDRGEALSGGSVSISAVMDTSAAARAASPDGDTLPVIRVEARDIPIDPLLIRAVAGQDSAGAPLPAGDETMGPSRLADLLTRLGLSGRIDSDADIVPGVRDGRSVLDYTIRSTLKDLTADIAEADTLMRRGSGTAVVDRRTVELDITGDLFAPATASGKTGATADGASLRATIALPPGASWGDARGGQARSPDQNPTIVASLVLPSADFAIPAEPIVGLFDSGAAQKLRDLRALYEPVGRLGATTTIRGRLGDGFAQNADIAVALDGIDRLDFDYQGLRLRATASTGTATVLLGAEPRIAFDGFAIDVATMGAAGSRGGTPNAAGRLGILETVLIGEAFKTTPLSITLSDGRFRSPLTRQSIARMPALWGLAETYDPRGLFDLTLRRRHDGRYEGQARPRSITVDTPRGDLAFPTTDGVIDFKPTTGSFKRITASSPDASLALDGAWVITPDGTEFDVVVDADAVGMPAPLLGLAPLTIGEIFDALEIGVGGTTRLDAMALRMRALPTGGFADIHATGTAHVTGASLAIGLPITELSGAIRFDARRVDFEHPAKFTLDVTADRARLMGLRVTNASSRIASGAEAGSVLVPTFGADSHGGRITASVRLSAPEGGLAAGDRRYWTDLQLAEIRIAPMLEDVRIKPDTTLADEIRADFASLADIPDPDAVWNQSADRSRGLISGSFSLAGTVGEAEGRRGRGRLIAGGGPVLQLPLLTRLIEFSNLQLPIGDELGLAYADLILDGRGVTFEDFAVLSGNIELQGYGDMTLPGNELDIRVRSRAVNRIPVITDVVESFRDELITTRISGTIAEPVVSSITLEETRRVVGSLLGGSPEGDARLREISEMRTDARLRIRQAGALLQRSGSGQHAPRRSGGNDAP